MSVGRNELCPCGSGKKYKKCCGVVTDIAHVRMAREQKLRKEFATWTERLTKYVVQHVSDLEISRARDRFAEETGLSIRELFQPRWMDHFMNWYVFDVKNEGVSVLDHFIGQYGKRMDQEIKDGLLHLQLGLYEITSVTENMTVVTDVYDNQERNLIPSQSVVLKPGQLLLGRLIPLGYRDSIFSGSLMVSASLKEELLSIVKNVQSAGREAISLALYKRLNEQGVSYEQEPEEESMVRFVYEGVHAPEIRRLLKTHGSFESKKQEASQEIWIYATQKDEFLIRSLDSALLELHEVAAELILEKNRLIIEGYKPGVEKASDALQLSVPTEEELITQLSSTGTKLAQGTLFITSVPILPPKVLQWAIQSYFTEKWVQTPQMELQDVPPLLVAASDKQELKDALDQIVEKLEQEEEMGQGIARFMNVEVLKTKLSMSNRLHHVANLLDRPLIEGLPESIFTVRPEVLADIASFVEEMTAGKSELTMKKYDETMNLFRTFIRNAFGPSFGWNTLRIQHVAYFLAHDVLERVDSPSKTLAINLLSVLTAFFKWLDKKHKIFLTADMLSLIGQLKEDLPEAYRMRTLLSKEAVHSLHQASLQPQVVLEEMFAYAGKKQPEHALMRQNGEQLSFVTEQEIVMNEGWSMFAITGLVEDGKVRLYGAPEIYPPAITELVIAATIQKA